MEFLQQTPIYTSLARSLNPEPFLPYKSRSYKSTAVHIVRILGAYSLCISSNAVGGVVRGMGQERCRVQKDERAGPESEHLGPSQAVGHSSPQLKLSWRGLTEWKGPLRHISGARGRGGLPGTTTSLGEPRARRFATGVSRKHIFSAATWRTGKPKHVDLSWPHEILI